MSDLPAKKKQGLPGFPALPRKAAAGVSVPPPPPPVPQAKPVVLARPVLNVAPVIHQPSPWQLKAKPGEQLVLMPGQMYFGPHASVLRTLLGSCVALTLWHPTKHIGGMCHFLLPSRRRGAGEALDGRYGDEAIQTMVAEIQKTGTKTSDYHCHLYGGADTMPDAKGVKFNVGERNIELGWALIEQFGFQLQGVDVGDYVPRNVTLVTATGAVEMRRGVGAPP